ncbi:MAG: transporter [Haloplasmataceae bacterium]|jgi:ABC-2 type transport system ATP-binding protein|nr:transporter [Haloplasmataceae bacterium]
MIEVTHLSKNFKVIKKVKGLRSSLRTFVNPQFSNIKALDDVSFKINEGEIVGYIGPNGAGKSTTIKIMSGILVPDSGSCQIMGVTPWKNRIEHVKNIGVVFGQRTQLWWDVPVIDSFYLLKDIYKITNRDFKHNLDLLTTTLDLSQILTTPVRQLSLGQRMRCEIGASLLHNPKILFLDEPTIGLDAVSKLAVRNFIKTINKEKKVTVILTTHDMNDIEALSNRIILVGKGKILMDGSLTELKNKFSTEKIITIDYTESNEVINITGSKILTRTKERISLSIDLNKIKVSEVINLISQKFEIKDISVENRPIDEIIIDLYKEYQV